MRWWVDWRRHCVCRCATYCKTNGQIAAGGIIAVILANLASLRVDTNQATVHFTQIYQDERLQSSDQKTMVWVWRNGQWQITREFTA